MSPVERLNVALADRYHVERELGQGFGAIGYERGELREGVRFLRAALERDPNDADVHFYLGISLIGVGQTEATAVECRRIAESDPLSPMTPLLVGVASWFVGRPAEGLESMERATALAPESLIHRWTLGYSYALLERVADASREGEFMRERAPRMPYTVQLRALVAAMEGRQKEARELLADVNTDLLDGHTRFHLGESFAMAGDTARAMELVEQSVTTNFYPLQFIVHHTPFLEPLKGSPAFDRILATADRRVREFQDYHDATLIP